MGRRIEKTATESGVTSTTRYLYDNEDILLETDATGKATNRYTHGPGIDEPLALLQGKNVYYYHADGLGSIVALTDSKGKVVQGYQYDSFGNLHDQMNRVKQPYTYTGREWDRETGLYYYRARYYDAQGGKFISKDPIGFGGGVNMFSYVQNNPVNRIDPLGLWSYATEYGTNGAGLTSNIMSTESTVDTVFNAIVHRDGVVTYTTNGTHKAKSLHYTGNAIDLRIRDLTSAQKQTAKVRLSNSLGSDYDVINEGDHIHLEYDPCGH